MQKRTRRNLKIDRLSTIAQNINRDWKLAQALRDFDHMANAAGSDARLERFAFTCSKYLAEIIDNKLENGPKTTTEWKKGCLFMVMCDMAEALDGTPPVDVDVNVIEPGVSELSCDVFTDPVVIRLNRSRNGWRADDAAGDFFGGIRASQKDRVVENFSRLANGFALVSRRWT